MTDAHTNPEMMGLHSEALDSLVSQLGEALYDDAHEGCDESACPGNPRPYYDEYARSILAWLLPAYDRIRKQAGDPMHGRAAGKDREPTT